MLVKSSRYESGCCALPRFAVCLAAFNGVRWLGEQLDSILTQKGVCLTVFVSVDASTDGTEAWIDQIAKQHENVVVLQHGLHFGGAAPNFFRLLADVDFSDFDYVSLADQDDIWLPEKLFHAHQMLSKTGADAYSSNVMAFWPDGRKLLVEKSQPQVQWDFLFEAAGPGCTYVIRKDLSCAIQYLIRSRWLEVQQLGLHDWFIYAYARANGHAWVIDDYASLLYRQHEKNQVGVNIGWRAYMHRVRKILGGWGLTQSVLIADLVGLKGHPFVRRWSNSSRAGLLSLSLNAWQCRRRPRDKLLFSLSCLALCFTGKPSL